MSEGPAPAPAAPRGGRRRAEIDPGELEALIRRGAKMRQAAAALGISERTLGAHLAKRPELQAAVLAGKRVALDIAADKLQERAAAGSVTAMKLILRRAVGRQAAWQLEPGDIGVSAPGAAGSDTPLEHIYPAIRRRGPFRR